MTKKKLLIKTPVPCTLLIIIKRGAKERPIDNYDRFYNGTIKNVHVGRMVVGELTHFDLWAQGRIYAHPGMAHSWALPVFFYFFTN